MEGNVDIGISGSDMLEESMIPDLLELAVVQPPEVNLPPAFDMCLAFEDRRWV